MIYAVALGLALALGAFISHVLRKAFESGKAAPGPTPEEAKLELQTVEQARAIVNEGEADKREVLNADRKHLLDDLRNVVRPKR